METRKLKEAEFHDFLRGKKIQTDDAEYQYYTSNKKFYSITPVSKNFCDTWLVQRCSGKSVLDYGCGDGHYALLAALNGATATGIDISEVSVENARQQATEMGVEKQVSFLAMDAEFLEFDDDQFDIICESGVLHHLNLHRAFSELARVLKSDGQVICMEALGHNPVIQWYRKRTPHLRTEYEAKHILRMSNVEDARRYFDRVEVHFFHLVSLLAVPFRNLPGFHVLLRLLEALDSILLRLPVIQRQAWIIVLVLSQPRSEENLRTKIPGASI